MAVLFAFSSTGTLEAVSRSRIAPTTDADRGNESDREFS
jgi:hypothetical protein